MEYAERSTYYTAKLLAVVTSKWLRVTSKSLLSRFPLGGQNSGDIDVTGTSKWRLRGATMEEWLRRDYTEVHHGGVTSKWLHDNDVMHVAKIFDI